MGRKNKLAQLLTLLTFGLITIGIFVGTKLSETGTKIPSKAAEPILQMSSTSCGDMPVTNGDERSGDGCSLNTKPEVSRECASCITAHQPGFREWWDSVGQGACNNVQIVSNWRQMEPDGKRNFYHGHTTEKGSPCECYCARELANPEVDYGNSPLPELPTSTPPAPTITTLPLSPTQKPSAPFRLPSIIYEPSPTLLPIPSPTTFEEEPPTINVPTDLPEPSDIISFPTLPSQNTPVPSLPPDIPYKQLPNGQISQTQNTASFIFNVTAKSIEFVIEILNNFLKETDY